MSTKYHGLRKVRDSLNERRDCAVVAASLACRVDYKKTHALFKILGRRDGDGTPRSIQSHAVRLLGCDVEKIRYPVQKNGNRYTPITIGKLCNRGYWMVFVSGHVLAVINGEVQDWSEGTRRRITEVWKVTVPRGSRS